MSNGHYKILIADDREDNLGLLREWLSSQDHYVRCARDGREALDLAREDPPDLILLDKVMPEVDGLSVARQLKKEDRFTTVPIIVLTGREDTRRHTIFDETGADDRMARLITFDEKTQLFNFRHFTERLAEEFKRARRYGNHLTLLMLDIDHFKNVNDRHGHLAGDQVLKEFGRIMSRSARETDLIARYGGEEFAVLLPQTTAVQGQRLGDRIRRSTEVFVFNSGDVQGGVRITVSAGVATYPINDRIQAPEDLVRAADEALYRAKVDGRTPTEVDPRSLAA